MAASRAVINVLRNALDVSSALSTARRRQPQPAVEEASESIAWHCLAEHPSDAWRTGDLLGRRFPAADIQLVTEPDGTFIIRIPLRSLAKEWGPRALPSA